jgi:hypothetical protein
MKYQPYFNHEKVDEPYDRAISHCGWGKIPNKVRRIQTYCTEMSLQLVDQIAMIRIRVTR